MRAKVQESVAFLVVSYRMYISAPSAIALACNHRQINKKNQHSMPARGPALVQFVNIVVGALYWSPI